MPIAKTLVFLMLVPGSVLFLVPYAIVWATQAGPAVPFGPFRYGAVVLWLGGMGVLAWCAGAFALKGRGTPAPIDPPKELVAVGLYRFVRNPMYVGALLVLCGQFLWFGSLWVLLYGACVALAFHLFTVLYEEPTLKRKFGDAYITYCETVPRWLPRLHG